MPPKLQPVHLRVSDAATGKPTPCRVRCTDPAGIYYAPYGRLTEFPTGINEGVGGNVLLEGKEFAYIDGACEIDLPPGTVHIEVHKGPEYRVIDQDFQVQAGKLSLRLNLERWVNLRDEGWYSGDPLTHFLSPRAALLEGQAEDLALVQVLIVPYPQSTSDGRRLATIPGILDFSGQEAALANSELQVAFNTLNTSPLGNLALLHCHRAVYPLHFDHVTWTLADWCGQCHRKRGLVLWPEVDGWRQASSPGPISEALANLLLGDIDALVASAFQARPEEFLPWYHLLNCGFRVPLAGGSAKVSNQAALGQVRTYARLEPGESLGLAPWIEAVRAGRIFLTTGPLLRFWMDAQEAGSTLQIRPGQDKVQVRAVGSSLQPLDKLQIIRGGEVVAEATGSSGIPSQVELELELPVDGSSWWAARCWGPGGMAHVSPIYVQCGETPFRPKPGALTIVADRLREYPKLLAGLEAANLLGSPRDKEKLLATFQAAGNVLAEKRGRI